MTRQEYAKVIDDIEDAWGSLGASWAKAENLFPKFEPFPYSAAKVAIDIVFRNGRQTAPSPSTLMAAIRDHVGSSAAAMLIPDEPCQHPSWAIITNTDGTVPDTHATRRAICAGCRLEQSFTPGKLLTATEHEDQKLDQRRQEQDSRW